MSIAGLRKQIPVVTGIFFLHMYEATDTTRYFQACRLYIWSNALMPLCLDTDANEICRNERGSSICTDIKRSATDWWCKPSPCSLRCDIWLVTPRGVKLITLWLAWPLLRNELNWRMTPAWARLAARWPNCGQRADHPNPVGMWPWPCHTLGG